MNKYQKIHYIEINICIKMKKYVKEKIFNICIYV